MVEQRREKKREDFTVKWRETMSEERRRGKSWKRREKENIILSENSSRLVKVRPLELSKHTDVNSARGREVGKSVAGRSNLFSAKTFILNINNSITITHNIKKEQKKTSFEVFGDTPDYLL